MKIIAILTIVAIVLIAVFFESKRRDQLAAVAAGLGLSFDRGHDLLVAEDVVGGLGDSEQVLDELLARFDAPAL